MVDIAISRFGTMFFHDPVRAFTNVARALRPGGRLVMIVWQSGKRNEWEVAIQHALAPGDVELSAATDKPDPFSLGNADALRQIIGAAGFVDVTLADVDEPVFYGCNVDEAVQWVRQFVSTRTSLQQMDRWAQVAALRRLRMTMAAHHRAEGVWFDSRAWLVTARRA